MTYVPTPDDFKNVPPEGSTYVPTPDDFSHVPPPSGALHNFMYGLANTAVNVGNVVPNVINAPFHALGMKGNLLPVVPQLHGNYDPKSLSYMGGEFGGALAASLTPAGEARDISLLKNIPTYIKNIGGGALLGSAVSQTGKRGSGALGGAAGGAIGELAGSAIKSTGKRIFNPALMNKIKENFAKKYSESSDGKSMELAKQIASVKKQLDKNNIANYGAVWHELSNNAGVLPGMGPDDFPEYTKEYNALSKGSLPPLIKGVENIKSEALRLKSDKNMQAIHEAFGNQYPHEASKISPQDVHFYKSSLYNMGSKGRAPKDNEEYIHNVFHKALGHDLENFLEKHSLSANNKYKYAQSYYRNTYHPFVTHPGSAYVNRQLGHKNLAYTSKDAIDHLLDVSDWRGKTKGPSALFDEILPPKGSDDLSKFYSLGRLTTGDPKNIQPKWVDFAKKTYLNKETKGTGEKPLTNSSAMLKRYSDLTGSQREMYFSPKERQLMDLAEEHFNKNDEKLTLSKLGKHSAFGALGSAIGIGLGHHLLGNEGALLGMTLGIPTPSLLASATRGSIEKRLPSELENLSKYSGKSLKTIIPKIKHKPSILAALGSTIGGHS